MGDLFKAIFLDRDGIINRERSDYVKTISELEIFTDIPVPLKKLKEKGFLIVVITNQSAINRGLTNHENVNDIHSKIQEYLREYGISIDAFYYCPHRPDENCSCRKPKPGLLLQAAHDLKIDLKSSWMIGDSDTDMQAAKSAGCNGLKVCDGFSLMDAMQRILNSDIDCSVGK